MVPSGWTTENFESLGVQIIDGDRGKNYPQKIDYLSDGFALFLGAENVFNDGLNLKNKIFLSQEKHEKLGKGIVKFNDLLLIMRGNGTGRICCYDKVISPYENARINSGLIILRLNDHKFESIFALQLMRSDYVVKQFESYMFGSAQPQLTVKILKSLNLLVPPLQEQRKIAKILATWDEAISTTEKLISSSKQQNKALMQQLLTGKKRLIDSRTGKAFEEEWEEVRLSDICHINPKKADEPANGLVSFIPMDAVSEDAKLLRKDLKTYSEVSKGFTSFIDGDTLIAKITPCFENGKGAKVAGLENHIGFGSTEFHVIRAKKKICPDFIYLITITSKFRVLGEMNMQGSAGQKRVTTDYLKLYKLQLPLNIKEQQKIAQVLTAADKEIETLEAKLSHLKQEKKALMQQLLTGKRRVKVGEIEQEAEFA